MSLHELLEQHLSEPLENTIFSPDGFTITVRREPRSMTTATKVRLESPAGSYSFDMLTQDGFSISANGNLRVPEHVRGRGIGTGLVRIREAFCALNGAERIVIGENQNDAWWERCGYTPALQPRYYRALGAGGLIRYDEQRFARPREKILTAQPINDERNQHRYD